MTDVLMHRPTRKGKKQGRGVCPGDNRPNVLTPGANLAEEILMTDDAARVAELDLLAIPLGRDADWNALAVLAMKQGKSERELEQTYILARKFNLGTGDELAKALRDLAKAANGVLKGLA